MKHLMLLALIVFTLPVTLPAQVSDSVTGGMVYKLVDHPPKAGYPLNEYLSKTLKYPKKARKEEIQGRVIVRFVVNEDGHISDVVVVKGVHKLLDDEAIRVVSNMPPWSPGVHNGKTVRVYFNLPIVFELEDDSPPKEGEPRWKKK